MAITGYRVLQSAIVDGATSMPEKAILLGITLDGKTGERIIAFMMRYDDWAEEFPEDAKKEIIAEHIKKSEEPK